MEFEYVIKFNLYIIKFYNNGEQIFFNKTCSTIFEPGEIEIEVDKVKEFFYCMNVDIICDILLTNN